MIPNTVAGKIAHSVRAAEWPTLLVAGNSSIHAAVKCLAAAARFVEADGLAVAFEPRFRDADHSRALLALRVLPTRAGDAAAVAAAGAAAGAGPAAAPAIEIKVSSGSRHAKVGAALSARLSEAPPGQRVSLIALGESAVANAVMATAHAAHYLRGRARQRLAVRAGAAVVVKGSERLSGAALSARLQPDDGGGGGGAGGAGAAAGRAPDAGAGAGDAATAALLQGFGNLRLA